MSSLVVTLLDQCLAAYPPCRVVAARGAAPRAARLQPTRQGPDAAARQPGRDCDFDVQGRILLPPPLRASAGLQQEAVVVGVLNRFEVWAPAAWEAFLRESERLLDDVALEVAWPLPPAPPPELPRPPLPGPLFHSGNPNASSFSA